MPTTQLTLGVTPQKYGLITVFNPDGTINRQVKITGAEYRALGTKGASAPPGVTETEWHAVRLDHNKDGTPAHHPLAIAAGKDYDVGDAASLPDGSVKIKVVERFDGVQFISEFITIKSTDVIGVLPSITVSPVVLAAIDQSKLSVVVESITNGVVAWR